ncbi:CZB domain-containing protein [Marinobacter hydrocarbonoclasticus]|nr:CZB domain-containing protein [Marinobacter nauticus]
MFFNNKKKLEAMDARCAELEKREADLVLRLEAAEKALREREAELQARDQQHQTDMQSVSLLLRSYFGVADVRQTVADLSGAMLAQREQMAVSAALYDQSLQAVNQISQLIHRIDNNADKSDRCLMDIPALVEEADKGLRTVLEALAASNAMHGAIERNAERGFIETVKMDHLSWKATIYRAAVSGEAVGELGDHTTCRLGQWYYRGDGQKYHAGKLAFYELEAPHQAVHQFGVAALQAVHEGHPAGDLLLAMEEASDALMQGLDRLIHS